MAVDRWLVDKSALVRLGASSMAEEWAARIQRGLVHVCGITLLEVGFSARSSEDLRESVIQPPISHMPVEHLTPGIENRAREVQAMLAARGQHRGPSIPDLLIAATAELNDLVILHVDKDYQLISGITGQRQEWLAMEGTTKATD